MNPNQKSTKDAVPDPPFTDRSEGREAPPATAFANLFHKGLTKLAEVQKSVLDIFAQQSADAHNAWKQAYRQPSATPALLFMEWAVRGVEKSVDAQKNLLDLSVQQSALVTNATKERADSASKFATNLTDMVQQSTDRMVAAEKVVVDFAAQQNAAVTDLFRRQFGFPESTPTAMAADSIRRGVDFVLETQKELLDLASKPFKAATVNVAGD